MQYRVKTKVLEVFYYSRLVIKNDSMHPKGSSRQDILQLIIDKYRKGGIDPSCVDNIFKETNIWLALTGSGTKSRYFNQPLGWLRGTHTM